MTCKLAETAGALHLAWWSIAERPVSTPLCIAQLTLATLAVVYIALLWRDEPLTPTPGPDV